MQWDPHYRLIFIHLLPLMYWVEMQDIKTCKCLQDPNDTMNIYEARYIISLSYNYTRDGLDNKLI